MKTISVNYSPQTKCTSVNALYQYDRGVEIRISGMNPITIPSLHFSIDGAKTSITTVPVLDGEDIVGIIPDAILMQHRQAICYVYVETEEYGYTEFEIRLPIIPRGKPSDFVLTSEQEESYNALLASLNSSMEEVRDLVAELRESEEAFVRTDMDQAFTEEQQGIGRANLLSASAVLCDASGAFLSLSDAAAQPDHGLVSTIVALQSGTGIPSPDNVRNISGWDTVSINRTARNLVSHLDLKKTAYGYNGYTVTEDAIDLTEPSQYDYAYIPVHLKGGITYTLYVTCEVYGRAEDATGSTKMLIKYQNSSPNIVDKSATANGKYTQLVVCTPTNDIDDRILLYLNYGSPVPACVRAQVMLLEGKYTEDTIPAFEPCVQQKLIATMPETIYGGTLDWTTGVLTVTHGAITYDGTEEWTFAPANAICSLKPMPSRFKIGNQEANHICSHYRSREYATGASQKDKSCYTLNTTTLMIKDTSLTSLEEWKGYLAEQAAAGTPMTIVWQLKPSYYKTIQLTPQQLTLLRGENHIWSDAGDTTFTYVADTKLYIDNAIATLTAAVAGI